MNIREGFPPTSLVISVSCPLLVQWSSWSSSIYLHGANVPCSENQEQQLRLPMLCGCPHDALLVCYFIVLFSEIKWFYLLVFMCVSQMFG